MTEEWAMARARAALSTSVRFGGNIFLIETFARVIEATAMEKVMDSVAADFAADTRLRAGYARKLGILDAGDSTPCWDDLVDEAKAQGFRDGIEAAAKRIEGGSFLHEDAPDARWAVQAAAVIRKITPRTP